MPTTPSPHIIIPRSVGRNTTLYHYTNIKGLLSILDPQDTSEITLWASNLNFLNDSTEFTLAFDLALLSLEYAEQQGAVTSAKCLEIKRKLSEWRDSPGEKSQYYTCSLTEHKDDLSQWRGYGGSNGYAIGFNRDGLERLPATRPLELKQCIYVSHPNDWLNFIDSDITDVAAQIDIKNRTDALITALINESNPSLWDNIIEHGISHLTYIKNKAFQDEGEFRIVLTNTTPVKFREGVSNLVPFVDIKLSWDLVEEINVGPSPNINLAENSIQRLKANRHHLRNINITKSKIPYRNW